MDRDRYLMTVLTVIAVAVSILAFEQLASPAGGAPGTPTEASPQPTSGEVTTPVVQGAGTLPVRWLFPYFAADDDDSGRDCQTHVTILNLAPKSVAFEVDFLQANTGNSAELISGTVQSARTARVLSGASDHAFPPYVFTANTGALTFEEGYVKVHADDLRIAVQGTLLCTPGGANDLEVVQTLSAMPVGATLDFFEAGMSGPGTVPEGHLIESES